MSQSDLLQRLGVLRRTIRRRLALFGLCAVISGGVVAFLVITLLDWLLWLPGLMRLVIGVAYVCGGIAALVHWVVRPLCQQLSVTQLAAKLEQYVWPLADGGPGRFDDRLSSSVEFLLGDQAGSEEMRRQVIDRTDRMVRDLHFRDALSLRPLAWRGAGLAAAAAVLAAVVWGAPGFASIGIQRIAAPLSGVQWPRDVEILPLAGDTFVAAGESTTLRMRIVRGLHDTLRGVVHLRSPDGEVTTLAMQREGEGDYTCTVSAITRDLVCWFEAGDDSTADRPLHIQVIQRPAVVQALATIEPPDYAVGAASATVDLDTGEVAVVRGSTLTVSLRTSKPVRTADAGAPDASLVLGGDQIIPLQFTSGDSAGRDELEADFTLEDDVEFLVRLTDDHGFENRSGRTYRVRAEPDQPPTVAMIEPRSAAEVTPSGSVSVVVRADDDFGITSLRVVGRELGTDEPFEIPLNDSINVTPAGDRVLALAEHVWDIGLMNLQPGATLVFCAEAADNYAYAGAKPQLGRSPEQRLKIISQADFDDRLRDRIALVQDRIRQAMLDQQMLKDDTDVLAARTAGEDPPVGTGSDAALDLSSRQGHLGQRIQETARILQRIRRDIGLNTGGDPDKRVESQNQLGQLADDLVQTARGPAASATVTLARAGDSQTSGRGDLLEQAGSSQQQVIDALRRVIHLTSQWGDFQEVVNNTRDLLDRQQALRADTAAFSEAAIGQRPDELSEELQAQLRQIERRQTQLAEEADGALARMRRLAERNREQDPAGADALEQAVRAAIAGDVAGRMDAAAKAVSANRTSAALIEQRSAETALAKMLAGLQERQQRELAELAKRLERFEQVVAELLRQQKELLQANREAQQLSAEDQAFIDLAPPQHTLRRNALGLADDMADAPGGGGGAATAGPQPAHLVRKSVEPMGQAEAALIDADGPQAAERQEEAIDLLTQAAERLNQLADQAKEEAYRRSLAALQAKLESIRSRQHGINGRTAEFIDRSKDEQRLNRADNRQVAQLAREQDDLRPEVQDVRGQLDEAAVYRWVIDRVFGLVGRSVDALRARRLDDALADDQQSVVEELDLLINALAEAAALPSPDEYADGGGGGSGGGPAKPDDGSPIPSVAELLVLKAMQLDVNTRTARMAGGPDAEPTTEAQLRSLRRLAERQEQIRELTETVTRRVQAESGAGR